MAEPDRRPADPSPPQPKTEDSSASALGDLQRLLQEEGVGLEGEDPDQDVTVAEPAAAPAAPPPEPARKGQVARRADARSVQREANRQAFARLDASSAQGLQVRVSEDSLQVAVRRMGQNTTYEEVILALRERGVTHGIEHEAIRQAVARARRRGAPLEVVVARGRSPVVRQPARVAYHLPLEQLAPPGQTASPAFLQLRQALTGPSFQALEGWNQPAAFVRAGTVLAEVLPAQVGVGEDVFGRPVQPADLGPDLTLQAGANTSLADDGKRCVADVCGYAGVADNAPTVLPPLWMSPAYTEARYVALPGCVLPPLPPEEVRQVLEVQWVEHGILAERLENLQRRLARGKPLPATVLVARGKEPEAGRPGRLEYPHPVEDLPPLAQVQRLLEQTGLAELQAMVQNVRRAGGSPRFQAVGAGEVVVERIPATDGQPGLDLRGEEILPAAGQDVELTVGKGISVSADGTRGVAEHFGYLARAQTGPVLVPPLWAGPERTQVYFLNLPQGDGPRYPSAAELAPLLEAMGVRTRLDAARWEELRGRLQAGRLTDALVPLVSATQPAPGRDGQIRYAHPPDKVPDAARLRRLLQIPAEAQLVQQLERYVQELRLASCAVVLVAADQVVAERTPPVPGEPGLDLQGNPVPPAPVQDCALEAGDGVQVAVDGLRAVATEPGYLCQERGKLAVVSPLWAAADRSAVFYVYLPLSGGGAPPPSTVIEGMLARRGVSQGFDAVAWDVQLIDLEVEQRRTCLLPLARITPPEPGTDAALEHPLAAPEELPPRDALRQVLKARAAAEAQQLAEALARQRGAKMRLVRPGDVLARKTPPCQGKPGVDLRGKEVPPPPARDLTLAAGDGASVSADGLTCTASRLGYLCADRDRLGVVGPVWVSGDKSAAHILCFPGQPALSLPSLEEAVALLREAGLAGDVAAEPWSTAVSAALVATQAVLVPVLAAVSAQPGPDARAENVFPEEHLPDRDMLARLFSLREPEAVAAEAMRLQTELGVQFRAVQPGEVLVRKVPAGAGTPGRDLNGRPIAAPNGRDVPLRPGEQIVVAPEGLTCVAERYGYLCLDQGRPCVFTPLWIAVDSMQACFVFLPQQGAPSVPTHTEMVALLQRAKAAFGYDPSAWVELRSRMETGWEGCPVVPIAQGVQAVPGTDARFDWEVSLSSRTAGRVKEDGSIDYRDTGGITTVKAGQVLGHLFRSRPGTAGTNVLGRPLTPAPPRQIEVALESGARAEADGDQLTFVADIAGAVWHQEEEETGRAGTRRRIRLGVHRVSSIEGDVDYSTGNIDFDGDVTIGGTVRPHFTVKATGSVTIEGLVESGAQVTGGTTVTVKGGICGATTQVTAVGDVVAKFVQESSVVAGGSITVSEYLLNASVRAVNEVVSLGQGKGRSGAVIGGLVWAGRGIRAQSMGSPYNAGTRLVTGVDPEHPERLEAVRARQRALGAREAQLLQKLHLRQADPASIKRLLAANPSRKDALLACIAQLVKVMRAQEELQARVDALAEEQLKLAQSAIVAVGGTLHAGVELRIGEQTLVVKETQQKVLFRLVEEDGEIHIDTAHYTG